MCICPPGNLKNIGTFVFLHTKLFFLIFCIGGGGEVASIAYNCKPDTWTIGTTQPYTRLSNKPASPRFNS